MPLDPDTVASTALGPKRVTVDGQSVEYQSVDDQIKAYQFQQASVQQTGRKNLPIRLARIKPGGAA